MTYRNVIVPQYDYSTGTKTLRHTVVKGEGVSGLLVHHDHKGRGWVVSNHAGLAIAGAPVGYVELTRAQARKIAREVGPLMATEVKQGRLTGKQWIEKDAGEANAFREMLSEVVRNV